MRRNKVLYLFFIFFILNFSLSARFVDLGRDPKRVRVKKIIKINCKNNDIFSKFKGWVSNGKYIMIEKNGDTLLYNKEGKYYKRLSGIYCFATYDEKRLLTSENNRFYVYNTDTWELIKDFTIDKKKIGKPFAFYKDLDYLIILKATYINDDKSKSAIIKYNYITNKKEVVYKKEDCEELSDPIYIPENNIFYSKYYCKDSVNRGKAEYLLNLKTRKVKWLFDGSIMEVFKLGDIPVFENNTGETINLRNLKIIESIKLNKKNYLEQSLKKHYGYVDLWTSRIMPNGKLYIKNIGVFNDSVGGDYPLDSYIFIYDINMRYKKMLNLKNPTTLPETINFFSPEGDRFVAVQDYKRFILVLLERR